MDVNIPIPEVDVPAGAPLLWLSTMLPGLSKPQTINSLIVNDGFGPVPLKSRNQDGTGQWSSTRAVKGELVIQYREPVENAPMTQGGPPLAPRIDGDSEGNVVYYQALLPWRAGMITSGQFLEDLNKTASRYYTNPLKDAPDDQILPRFWEDSRIRVLPYDRGGMYFAVLNGKIGRASAGKRSIDDLIRAMIDRSRADQPVTEAIWLDLLRKEIGEDGPAVHRSMMAGGLMLPESNDFGPCFRRTTKKIRRFELGFDPKSLTGGNKTIRSLMPDSEAAKAGLREGDDVSYGVALDAVQAEVGRTLTLQVTRDGRTFPVTYLPRGESVDAYQWERVSGIPEDRCLVRVGSAN